MHPGMNLGIFEDSGWRNLLPLTWLRPASELRCGAQAIGLSVELALGRPVARRWLRPAIAPLFDKRLANTPVSPGAPWCLVNSRALITGSLEPPAPGVAWMAGDSPALLSLAATAIEKLAAATLLDDDALRGLLGTLRCESAPATVRLVRYPWNLVSWNAGELLRQAKTAFSSPGNPLPQLGEHDGQIYLGVHLVKPEAIAIGESAKIKPGVVLDAETGPIVIDEQAELQPNAVVIGPAYIGRGAIIRPNAIIRENTSIGPGCRVGGEVEGSIMHGYCNKQHDGFLGHSYVAPWVNLGAGTITSDLKNTYGPVRVKLNGVETDTGEQFVGSTIGDHTKTGIGTILPTGCVLGVAANVFAQSALPRFVPSFSWFTGGAMQPYELEKAVALARMVMGRRKIAFTAEDESLLRAVAGDARQVESAGW